MRAIYQGFENGTEFREAIDPSWSRIAGEAKTDVVTEVIAVLRYKVVRIAGISMSELVHELPHLARGKIRPPDQNRLPESESGARSGLRFEDPRRGVIVSAVRVLHSAHCKTLTPTSIAITSRRNKERNLIRIGEEEHGGSRSDGPCTAEW